VEFENRWNMSKLADRKYICQLCWKVTKLKNSNTNNNNSNNNNNDNDNDKDNDIENDKNNYNKFSNNNSFISKFKIKISSYLLI